MNRVAHAMSPKAMTSTNSMGSTEGMRRGNRLWLLASQKRRSVGQSLLLIEPGRVRHWE